MKRTQRVVLSFTLAIALLTQTGCIGSFKAVTGLYDWNKRVATDKWLQELLFVGLVIIPVYGIWAAGDMIIFNSIEFWTGSNPLSMNEGDHEMQEVTMKGERYRIETTKDTYTTTTLTGRDKGAVRVMRFDRCDHTWKYSDADICDQPLITYLDDMAENIRVYTANGSVNLTATELKDTDALLAKLNTSRSGEVTCAK